jgi:hypothetical protein
VSLLREELRQILHIGADRADQALQLRPFASVDSMDRIAGIGPDPSRTSSRQGCLTWPMPAATSTTSLTVSANASRTSYRSDPKGLADEVIGDHD